MIEFGQVKVQLLILLIYPLGILFARAITFYLVANPFYYLFLFFISHFLTLIPLLYINIRKSISKKRRMRQEEFSFSPDPSVTNTYITNTETEDLGNQIKILKGRIKDNRKRNKILLFLLIGFLYYATYLFFYFISYIEITDFYGNMSIATEVLYFSLFNWVVLGNRLYSHHLFSMILITISIISLYVILIIKNIINNDNWNAWKDFFFSTILCIIIYCFYCYCLVLAKYYMEKYFISAYKLIFYLGLFCLFLLIITEPITHFIPCNTFNVTNSLICDIENGHIGGLLYGFKDAKKYEIRYSVFLSLSLFLTCLGLWLTVKELSPCHFLTSDSIITFELNLLFDIFNNNTLKDNILFYIFISITIFGCFVYNEIIIINVCNLDFNTRKQILKRQSKDLKETTCELAHFNTTSTLSYTNETSECNEVQNDFIENDLKSPRRVFSTVERINDRRATYDIKRTDNI